MIHFIPAQPKHAPQIAWLIMEAMNYDCCLWFMGKGHTLEEFHQVITTLVERERTLYSYQNTLVAIEKGGHDEEVIAACVSYAGKDVALLRTTFEKIMLEQFHKDYSTLPYETQNGEYYIDTLCVRKEYRGRGIATTLLQMAIEKGRKLSLPTALLVDESNPSAEKLYRKNGFITKNLDTWGGHKMKRLIHETHG